MATAMLLCVHVAAGQNPSLDVVLHQQVQIFAQSIPDNKGVQEMRAAFSGYDQKAVATALIDELSVNMPTSSADHSRTMAVGTIYQDLALPPSFVCEKLDRDQSPQEKVKLIYVFFGYNKPEVTAALLKALKDKRPAVEYIGWPEEPVYPLRVCDEACNTLSHNLTNGFRRIGYGSGFKYRDKAIARILKELHLTAP